MYAYNSFMQIDFGLGIIFFMYFLLRLIASENLFSFLFSLDTIIDLITLPPLLLSMFLGRTWIGLRFFRFLYIANLSNILVYVGVLSGSTNIRLTQVIQTHTNKGKQKCTFIAGISNICVHVLVRRLHLFVGESGRSLS